MKNMEWVPLHFGDQLTVINPEGTVGIVTLWSRVDYVLRQLQSCGVNLDPSTSPIAVLGTLYGNGLRELLRNLLYNPQIDTLLLYGRDRSGSAEELAAFFAKGLEPHADRAFGVDYEPVEGLEIPKVMHIRGTNRALDSLVRPEQFQRPPRVLFMGDPQKPASSKRLRAFLHDYQPFSDPVPPRREIPLPQVRIVSFPSNPRQHTICADEPLTAWKELVYRIHRFGIPVRLAKGERRELQNVKVVVEKPAPVPTDQLRVYGFDEDHLRRYQKDILSGVLGEDETYNYGHRLRTYFGLDSLNAAADRLRNDPEDRKSYAVLWDPWRDLVTSKGHPCLVSLFFRRFQNHLTLTAVFRTHNALDAWLVNFYGLMAIRNHVCSVCEMSPGAITVFSHSITIDTRQLDRAALIASGTGFRINEDPMGYFRITLDEEAIVAEHRIEDVTLKVYRHSKASRIQHEIYRDGAVSDINHAIYLGRQLARAEFCLKENREFVQE